MLPGYARTFGLGQPTRIAGVAEIAGTVPDPTWKQQQFTRGGSSGDSVNLAIGQGYLLATPLQMANAYAALARGGSLLAPTLVSDQEPEGARLARFEPGRHATAILDGMKRVTSTPAGTAYYAFQGRKAVDRGQDGLGRKRRTRTRTPGSSATCPPTNRRCWCW